MERRTKIDTTLPGELRYFAVTLSPKIKELEIVPTGDVHYGNHLCSTQHYARHIAGILAKPGRYTILMGDLCEAVMRDSVGDIYHQRVTPQEQRDWHIKMLTPIRDKILGMVTGNHENRVLDRTGIDISMDIARALGVPYRPEGILLKVAFGGGNSRNPSKPYVYYTYATHGYGGARTTGAKAVKVERTATFVHADIYIMAHDHVVNMAPVVYLAPDHRTRIDADGFTTGKVVAHRKVLVKSSAFLKWGGYGESKGFGPVDLDTPVIKLAGVGEPRVRVEA